MTPLHQISQTSLGPWEWAFSIPGTVGGAHAASLPTQQYNFFVEQTPNISVYFMQGIKSHSIFTTRQTHRQTDAHFASGRDFYLYGNLYLLLHCSFIRLAQSLTLFVKDNRMTLNFAYYSQFSSL